MNWQAVVVMATLLGAAAVPLLMMWSHGEFVGQRQPPRWARSAFRMVACLGVGWAAVEFVFKRIGALSDLQTSDDIALSLATIIWVGGACGAAVIALREYREKGRQEVDGEGQ